jgi:hypothetical protein
MSLKCGLFRKCEIVGVLNIPVFIPIYGIIGTQTIYMIRIMSCPGHVAYSVDVKYRKIITYSTGQSHLRNKRQSDYILDSDNVMSFYCSLFRKCEIAWYDWYEY